MNKLFPAALFAAGLVATPSFAAPVSWSPAAEIIDESVIQPDVIAAFNFFNLDTTTTVTTNGVDVDFVSTASGPVTSNGLTVTFTGSFNTGIPVVANMWNGTVLADDDFNNPIMDSFAHGPSGESITGSFELSGLTPGTQYSVQLFASDSRNNIGVRSIQYDDNEGNATEQVRQDTRSYFIGTFTASGTTQAFNAISDTTFGSSNGSPILNALTVAVAGPPQIPGDTDGDGDIDDADLGTSFSNYTGPLAPGVGGKDLSTGDTDGDGDVDDADLGTSFAGYTGPLTAAVPEPTSLALLSLGGLLVTRRRCSPSPRRNA